MRHIFEIALADGQTILIEASDQYPERDALPEEVYKDGVTQTGAKERLQEIGRKTIEVTTLSLERLTDAIVSLSSGIYSRFSELPHQNRPDKVQIEYSIEITSGADIKVARSSGTGAIKVVTEWKSEDKDGQLQ
jgi:hypothetical protein